MKSGMWILNCHTFMLKHCGIYAAVLTNYASFSHRKCFSDSPKDLYWWSQNVNNQTLVCSILICWCWCH